MKTRILTLMLLFAWGPATLLADADTETVTNAVSDNSEPSVAAPVPDPLTMDQAVSAAINNHPQLRAAESAVSQQQHMVYQVTRKPNPTVGYLASEVGNDGEAGQQGVFISQNVVRGNKLCLNGKVRQRDVSIAMQELEVRRQTIAAETRLAFIEVAVAQERLKLLKRLQLSLNKATDAVKRLVDSGELSLTASLQSRLEAQRNQMQIRKTETQFRVSQASLAALLGWPLLSGGVAETALLPLDNAAQLEDAWTKITNGSPELLLAQCRYDRTHWQVRREEAEPIPDLQTQWSLQQDAATNHTVLGIQLGVELPIRDTNSGAIQAARADTWRTHHQIDGIRRSLRRRLVVTIGRQQQASEQLQTIKDELQNLAKENLHTTQNAFALGEASYLDLLNAQRGYIRLNLDTLLLYRQIAVSEAHLQTFLVRANTAN